jgi:TonB family protein
MKNKLLLAATAGLLLLVLCPLGNSAAQDRSNTSLLWGTWRYSSSMVVPKDSVDKVQFDTTHLTFKPLRKLLGCDGKFYNLLNTGNASLTTKEYGTYDILSPSQYVEHVAKSAASTCAGKDNVITYNFLNNNLLLLSYELDSSNYRQVELWGKIREKRAAAVVTHANETIYMMAESLPKFPGVDYKSRSKNLKAFLKANIRYPEASRKNNVQGIVVVRFIVTSEGSIERPEVMQGLDEHCNAEALRVVKSMPKWAPGRNGGTAVSSFYSLPFVFKF